MSLAASSFEAAAYAPALRRTEPLRGALLLLTGASGALVFIEPSSYEVFTLLAMIVFVAAGLTLRAALLPLAILLVLTNIGYSISAAPLMERTGVANWVLTSWYLAATALFFAAALSVNTAERLGFLTRGYVVAGVIASLAAIAGYFRLLPGSEDLLLMYGRARGTFKDPNVLGAFLVLPVLLALGRVIAGRLADALRGGALLVMFTAAILLSFSRGAWGQVALASMVMLFLTFVTTTSPNQRVRIVVVAVAAVALACLFVAALLSIDVVADLFKERARFDQDYDAGHTGRFGRQLLGAIMALDVPFGIGPLQFNRYFPEDPHNSYLNAFMSGGWVSGLCYPTLVLLTLVHGLRCVFVATPWRPITIAVYAAFVGTAGESFIIDTDHWRHYFLLLGMLWGLIIAARAHAAMPATASLYPSAAGPQTIV
jgi:O-antigen ligase/polysaccharide polymerase Wzy-like membrane protein